MEFGEQIDRELKRRGGYLYQVKTLQSACLSLFHALELIESQGLEQLEKFLEKMGILHYMVLAALIKDSKRYSLPKIIKHRKRENRFGSS